MNTVIGLPMNLWTIILTSFFFFASFSSYGCELSKKNIVSLSGPVSTYLDQLGLINQVEAISLYHPIADFKGVKLAGGLYLSTSALKKLEGKIVYFDKSRELKKILNRFTKIQAIEIDSRRKTPRQVVELVAGVVASSLKGCESQVTSLHERMSELEKEILTKISKISKSIFFLGRISSKYPETVMSNDGFVYWLKKEKLLDSYPSELEYLSWSMKVISPMRQSHLFFGIQDSYNDGDKSLEKVSEKSYNVKYPGALTPGYTQLEFLKYLLNHF